MSRSSHDMSPLHILPVAIPDSPLTLVKRSATFSYYGKLFESLAHHAAKFVTKNTDGVENELITTLQAFLEASHSDCVGEPSDKSCCWFTIRITKPNNAFDVPRWHQDGRMFRYDEGREAVARSKYALTILGPPTLLLPADSAVFETITSGEEKFLWWQGNDGKKSTEEERYEAHDDMREWLSDKFRETNRVPVTKGHIVRFSWGRNNSPVHSEPQMLMDRVFMTVLYGSEAELRSMCEFRDVEFGKI